MSRRAVRCRECAERFYTDITATFTGICQNCDGSYDPTPQALADAKTIAAAHPVPNRDKPQSVDPRNPTPKKPKKG